MLDWEREEKGAQKAGVCMQRSVHGLFDELDLQDVIRCFHESVRDMSSLIVAEDEGLKIKQRG